MSCGERPPPGFGAAAAGRRPLRGDFGGTKAATRNSTIGNIKTETYDGNLEVLQQSQMQNEAMASQSSCQIKPSLAGNKNVSPVKGPYKRFRVDATKFASPVVNASNTVQSPCSSKKHKGLGKGGKLEDNEGATGLKPPTPINLFEDECVFCHSFRTSEGFHGPMVQYRDGRIVSSNMGNPTNTIYVHKKCMYWAPKVYLNGDTIVNLENEIHRASGFNCSRCRLPGAALGCYNKYCRKTYHVPCAVMIPECRWDVENLLVLCPKHVSDPLPCDEMSSPIMESDIASPILQNHSSQCPSKEEFFVDCHMEDKQINSLYSSNSPLLVQVTVQYLDKPGMFVTDRKEDQQVDRSNTSSSSSLPLGKCLDKEGISADYRREDKQANQSRTPVDKWILFGSVLSASEKDSLKKFASLTSSILAEEWDKNVTHVIVGTCAGITCGRSYEVLMAILSGKWVVTAGWIVDCLAGLKAGPETCLSKPIPAPEVSYEVKFFDSSRTLIDGPKKGRDGAAEVAPKLFSGLHFCLSAYMKPEDTRTIKTLIAAAEGQVLEGISPRSLKENLDKNPAKKVYFIYASTYCLDLGKEAEEAVEYWVSGAQVISQFSLYGAIAAYDARILERPST